jgi:hypothetical protein
MVMVRRLVAMSYTYTSWFCSPVIVVTPFISTRTATEGSSDVDKSCFLVESIVAKSESRTRLPTIMAEQRQLNMGEAI